MKLKKVLCYMLYYGIGYYLPKSKEGFICGIPKKIRGTLVKGFIDYGGRNINIQRSATIARRVSIGDFSGVGMRCLVQGSVTIGEHVMMGPEVYIYTQNHEFTSVDISMDMQGFSAEEPVVIEDDVWIGARVTILPGVTIGKGSIIGAAAVVAKDIPPYSIVVGNPAKVVKTRK